MKTYIVGNFKLNFTVGEASIYLHKVLKNLPNYRDYGAFTGEVSFSQLRGIVDYAIIGHSERRYVFREDDKMIAKKVEAAIRNKITPILCIGETESERAFGETSDVIRDQLMGGLRDVSDDDLDKVIIAYEPVWAISSTKASKLATPDEIAEVVKLIKKNLADIYGAKLAEKVPILFGGSVNTSNCGSYLMVPGINGLLIGGSSLILGEFIDIIGTAKRVRS